MTMTAVADVVRRVTGSIPGEEAAERLDREAEAWLRERWPEARLEDVRGGDAQGVLHVARDEAACAACREAGGSEDWCRLARGSRAPLVIVPRQSGDRTLYHVAVGPCPALSARDRAAKEAAARFERAVSWSGLSEAQRGQGFGAFEERGATASALAAKRLAMAAAEDGSWLVLAGPRGTGKTHLAVAVLLDAMRRGKEGAFRSVPEMLDSLREGQTDGEYASRMAFLKRVPCLVLDDLGKERPTSASAEWTFQIVDARYREGLQTVVTTNATSPTELAGWGEGRTLAPVVSRLMEMGAWAQLDGADHRVRRRRKRDG